MFGLLKHIQYMVFGFKWHVPCSSAETGALHGLNTRSLQEKPSAATAPSNQDEAGRSCKCEGVGFHFLVLLGFCKTLPYKSRQTKKIRGVPLN